MRPLRGIVQQVTTDKVVIRCENGIEFTTERRNFNLLDMVEVIMRGDANRTVTSVLPWDSLRGFDDGVPPEESEGEPEESFDDLDHFCPDCRYTDD